MTNNPVLIMCRPDYFSFQKPDSPIPEPNEFIKKGRQVYWDHPYVFHKQAVRQWENFVSTIQTETNAQIYLVPAQESYNTQVFTADPSLTLTVNGTPTVFLSRFSNDRRNVEIPYHQRALEQLYPNARFVEASHYTEGTGDNVYDPFRQCFWSGYVSNPKDDPAAGRSDKRAHEHLSHVMGVPVHGLHVKRPFFHIDTALAPLSKGHVLFYEDGVHKKDQEHFYKTAFDDVGLSQEEYLIPVSKDDALAYACNAVNIDDTVILPTCSDDLQQRLQSKGYRVITVDVDRFLLSGGGPHCMVNNIGYVIE